MVILAHIFKDVLILYNNFEAVRCSRLYITVGCTLQ
jgi:hypothetical protein